ncbi:cytochrome P450 [Lentinula raphanica]|uniref:Cytochrome P450 n=1 Tax=Lentinula raphanica TaxID=153919 RepID=A0AA38PKS7_9AGAR|nr:cytochrome P450 [Lentinula raphanica]KAJ3844760.1 cytochrome P450 [Lentinula raphanica]
MQTEFLSHFQPHGNILHPSSSNLSRSIVIVILSASIWAVLFHRRRLRSGVASLSQLRGPPSQSWYKGNYTHLFNLKQGWNFHKMLADNYGSVVKLSGFLGRKQLYTFDTKAMYHILIKEGAVFQPHRIDSGALLFGKGLLSTFGEDHRKQRKMLNPVFSIAHMRSMMPIFHDVVDQLRDALSQRVQSGPREIDLLSWMARTALELIGQSGFGYSFDNMVDDVPRHRYSVIVKDFVPTLTQLAFARFYLLPLSIKFLTKRVRVYLMNIIPWKALHDVRDMVNYMHEISVQVYEEKKRALEEGDEAVLRQIGKGKDLLSILMRENMKADSEDKLEESEIIAQMSTFIFAAMDTTSSALSRILHLLALHPEVQEKMRDELVAARKERGGSHLSYDELVGLPYLDAVCRETLRLYAPVSSILRKNTEDAVVPFSRPVRCEDGNEVSEVFVPKGTTVMISILNSNRNPDLWGPDVLEWKPERWLSPLPDAILNSRMPAVYSHLMTFNGGSRSCIGFKFSQLEMKVVIAMLVEHFKFSLAPKKEIFWQMSGIASPVIVGGSDSEYSKHPQLPLIVELAKQEV